jgi:hypothetical protein
MDCLLEALAAHNIAKSSWAHCPRTTLSELSGANVFSSSFHFGHTRLQLKHPASNGVLKTK